MRIGLFRAGFVAELTFSHNNIRRRDIVLLRRCYFDFGDFEVVPVNVEMSIKSRKRSNRKANNYETFGIDPIDTSAQLGGELRGWRIGAKDGCRSGRGSGHSSRRGHPGTAKYGASDYPGGKSGESKSDRLSG